MKGIQVINLLSILLFFQLSCKESVKHKTTIQIEPGEIENEAAPNKLDEQFFNSNIDGKEAKLFWISNDGIQVAITNYGGRIVGLWVNDKDGNPTDVVVGMDSAKKFKESTEPYFGATIGRVGNRIAKGEFILNDKLYTIPINNGDNTLHGGPDGFHNVVWNAEKTDANTLELTYLSPDMEMGFPGNLKVKVTYSVTSGQSLKIEYEAITDKITPVNLTNHAFFNLNGEGSGTILNHVVQFNANKYTPVDSGLIPTGKLENVIGTPFDFTTPHTIGERIEIKNQQLTNGQGYDHNFVLTGMKENNMKYVGSITGDKSQIKMEVYTEEPGIQFYSGNFMQSENTFKSGAKDDYRSAFALETQHFPDAPNHPQFPSIMLSPKDNYHTVSVYKFSINEQNKDHQ